MKNIPTAVLAAVTLGICCGGPLIVGAIGIASISWFLTPPGIALTLSMMGLVGAGYLFMRHKSQKSHCQTDE